MKVLNLYAGIGGNRKLWQDVEVTAVEYDNNVAEVYADLFPNDKLIIADAHEYLLNHYAEFDFIWSSPPCPTHSKMNILLNHTIGLARYPDMTLWQEIILLQNWFKGGFVVENVIPYYEPLIKPSIELHRHYFWANFLIPQTKIKVDVQIKGSGGGKEKYEKSKLSHLEKEYGIDLSKYPNPRKMKMLRNAVAPELGLHILNAYKPQTNYINNTQTLFEV